MIEQSPFEREMIAPVQHAATAERQAINAAVARLDAWFETMRGPDGYGGPVAHWWQQSLLYTGAGLDWRYEGIVAGYLSLWRAAGDERWLHKARRAGDDLLQGQAYDGHFAASSFEINPATAGTPHEAACDVALLLLARALRESGSPNWGRYAACAARNLRMFYIDQLWDADARSFRDDPRVPTFVPNKAATACEALFLLAEITGDEQFITGYALPTLDTIIAHQVRGAGKLDGAISQNSFGAQRVETYFPIYIARCVPALLRGYIWANGERYLDAALAALHFVACWQHSDGALPTVVYPNGRANRYPSWIAPLGDVLHAADMLRPHGFDADFTAIHARLLAGQDASGGIQTATGFAAQTGGRPPALPDVRDLLHVAGWNDKAFRYLAAHAGPEIPQADSQPFEADCTFRGQIMRFTETPEALEITRQGAVCYRWRKGARWPDVATPEFWLR